MRKITMCFLLWSVAAAAPIPKEQEFTNSIGLRLVRIEPGDFTMGFDGRPISADVAGKPWRVNGDFDEQPAHRVKITKPFYTGVFEVTNAQYEKFNPDHRRLRG